MALEVRPIFGDEVADFLHCLGVAFLEPNVVSEEQAAWWRDRLDFARSLAVFVDGTMAGTAGAFGAEITVPGNILAACALTQVTVLPNRRRRGLLTAMMQAHLTDAIGRDEPLAILVAAEWPIYGRFGFGPASEKVSLTVDTHAARFRETSTGSIDLVTPHQLRAIAPSVYERLRPHTVGALGRSAIWWDVLTDVTPRPNEKRMERGVLAVWRDTQGEARGYVNYDALGRFDAGVPRGILTVNEMLAETAEARRELWRFLCGVDLAVEARIEPSPIDDPLPFQLHDGRCVRQQGRSDHLWVRILDVAKALEARSYATVGNLVLTVHDPTLDRGGAFRLEVTTDGASVSPTTAEPDLEMSMSTLSAAYLGGAPFTTLAASGHVGARTPSHLRLADAMFMTFPAPFLTTNF